MYSSIVVVTELRAVRPEAFWVESIDRDGRSQLSHKFVTLLKTFTIADSLQSLRRFGEHTRPFTGRREEQRWQVTTRQTESGGVLAFAVAVLLRTVLSAYYRRSRVSMMKTAVQENLRFHRRGSCHYTSRCLVQEDSLHYRLRTDNNFYIRNNDLKKFRIIVKFKYSGMHCMYLLLY